MEKSEIINTILSYSWPTSEELVDCAERKFGFGGDDGAYGIVYPGDLDEHGRAVTERVLEFYCWECDADGLKIAEQDYLALLEQHLETEGEEALAERVRSLREPASCLFRPFAAKDHRRIIPDTDLRLRAQESLKGAIPPGLRAVSTEVRGHTIYWRCIFESEAARDKYRELLMDASFKVMGLFVNHADMKREFPVVPAGEEMQHLAFVLFQRYEEKG